MCLVEKKSSKSHNNYVFVCLLQMINADDFYLHLSAKYVKCWKHDCSVCIHNFLTCKWLVQCYNHHVCISQSQLVLSPSTFPQGGHQIFLSHSQLRKSNICIVCIHIQSQRSWWGVKMLIFYDSCNRRGEGGIWYQ